jgi:sulfate permease, SulP family
VMIGATCAVLRFVRSNVRDVVRHTATGETLRSLRVRPGPASEAWAQHGHRITIFEPEGSLFFGTADALQHRLEQMPSRVETAILDLRQVQDIDITAARILVELADTWARTDR